MSERVPAASLILDYNLYPRHRLDPVNLRNLSRAVEAGETLPPVVADQDSRRVVDGFHRVTLALRDGPAAELDVEWRTYPNEAAILLDAITANARHGRALTPYDQARCVVLADQLHVDTSRLAGALAIPERHLSDLRVSRTAYDRKGNPVLIKRPLSHLAGSTLTKRQVEANERSSGWSMRFHAEQIILALEADTVPDDEPTRQALARLAAALAAAAVKA